jgi:glycerophosphoryl diester phosphodiesterase
VPPRIKPLLEVPIAFAHRGARILEQENTMAAFRLALRLGAGGLESDVWLTADGVAVLDHDGTIGSSLRKQSISRVDRVRLPPHIPTLEELYAEIGPSVPLSLDIKDPAAFDATVAAARRAGAEDQLWICHPDLDLLIEWRRLTPARSVTAPVFVRSASTPSTSARATGPVAW